MGAPAIAPVEPQARRQVLERSADREGGGSEDGRAEAIQDPIGEGLGHRERERMQARAPAIERGPRHLVVGRRRERAQILGEPGPVGADRHQIRQRFGRIQGRRPGRLLDRDQELAQEARRFSGGVLGASDVHSQEIVRVLGGVAASGGRSAGPGVGAGQELARRGEPAGDRRERAARRPDRAPDRPPRPAELLHELEPIHVRRHGPQALGGPPERSHCRPARRLVQHPERCLGFSRHLRAVGCFSIVACGASLGLSPERAEGERLQPGERDLAPAGIGERALEMMCLVEHERVGVRQEGRVPEQVMDQERVVQDHQVRGLGPIPEAAEKAIVAARTAAPGTARRIGRERFAIRAERSDLGLSLGQVPGLGVVHPAGQALERAGLERDQAAASLIEPAAAEIVRAALDDRDAERFGAERFGECFGDDRHVLVEQLVLEIQGVGGDRHRHPLGALMQDRRQEIGERLADPGGRFDRQDAAGRQHIGDAARHLELSGTMLERGPAGSEEARRAEQVIDVERCHRPLRQLAGRAGRERAV